jgi:hypothetical protein
VQGISSHKRALLSLQCTCYANVEAPNGPSTVFEAGKLVDSVVVAAPDGPRTVLDADEVVDGAKNSMDSFAVSLDTGGRFADANESVHYHHRIDGYSCHGRVERVNLQEKCPEWVVVTIGPDGFCSIPDLVQIWSRFGPDPVQIEIHHSPVQKIWTACPDMLSRFWTKSTV